jgi:hypothetical protein
MPMGTEVQTTDFRDTFRGVAASRFHAAADMSLHELVDEFQRLSAVVAANLAKNEDGYLQANDTGKVAQRERNIVLGAARARFGISFDTYDSGEPGSDSF